MDKNNDALKAMQADAAKLGFQMASESDFAVTDEELEGDLEEVNEEAEVEELEAASQQEKLAFLNTRFEELKGRAKELRNKGAPDAAVEVVKQRAMVVNGMRERVQANGNAAITRMPQVPSIAQCLKAAHSTRGNARAAPQQRTPPKQQQRQQPSPKKQSPQPQQPRGEREADPDQAVANVLAALQDGQKLMAQLGDDDEDNFDDAYDDGDDDDDDGEIDVDKELAEEPEFPGQTRQQQLQQQQQRQQQRLAVEHAQRADAAGLESVDVLDQDNKVSSKVDISVEGDDDDDDDDDDENRRTSLSRRIRRSLSPLSRSSSPSSAKQSPSQGKESSYIALVETTTLKMQYESAVRKHRIAGNAQYAAHCEKMLSVLVDIEQHIRDGKPFDVNKLPSPPDPVKDDNAKAYDALEQTLRAQEKECLELAQKYHAQGKMEHEKRLKQFADKFKRDLNAVVTMRGRGQPVPSTEQRSFTFKLERLNLDLRQEDLAIDVKRGIAINLPKGVGKDYSMNIKASLAYPKDTVQEKHSKEHVTCEPHPTFNHTHFKLHITRDRRFKNFVSRGYVVLAITARKKGFSSWFSNEINVCECKLPLQELLASSEVHKCFPCGRSKTAKLEVVLRLQSPLEGRDLVDKEYTWTIVNPTAAKAAAVTQALEKKEEQITAALARSPNKDTSTSPSSSSSSPATSPASAQSSGNSKLAAYLHPKHITSHDVLMLRFNQYKEKLAPYQAAIQSGRAPKQVAALVKERQLCVERLKAAKATVRTGGDRLKAYLAKVLRERENYRKIVAMCKDSQPDLARTAMLCYKAATQEIEGARQKVPTAVAAAESAVKAKTSTTQATSPAKTTAETETGGGDDDEDDDGNDDDDGGDGAAPVASSSAVSETQSSALQPPPLSEIHSNLALTALYAELNAELQPHESALAKGAASPQVLKLARQRREVTQRMMELKKAAGAAAEGGDLKGYITQYMQHLERNRDAFIQLHRAYMKRQNQALSERYANMAKGAASEIEETKAVLQQL
ncbi:hypothetical protein PTSG_02103 [Salpingoeca rosetta]|uniref:Uncharacterized protein n=1 Tax=Salpingoeca rosetta (strain ATCC 50818 / BSB-021) TaxID=946362 RepID=F2U2M9_SALR5|nr:uncharacterized protein PTSG_02103 [Salpingoeca rosetta]EGD81384.1 hypothetical protein PTSG_02103 [Salpingoeca rosetta]|eukprot:XP_004996588.1 hypothetical protein PTSG_02103 [Salpingoeca rosetta]